MVVVYGKELQIITSDTELSVASGDSICFSSPVGDFGRIYAFVKSKIALNCDVFVADYSASNTDLVVLFILTLLNCRMLCRGKEYDLSFAYAVPLNKDAFLKDFVAENLLLCLQNRQLVFLPAETLYLYDRIPQRGLDRILYDERRTVKRNAQTSVAEVGFTDDFFNFWEAFDKERFHEIQTRDFQEFFRIVYSTEPFHLSQYSVAGEIVAYNVCYYSTSQKVIYDVLFPWKSNANVYRIGIYSMIRNLEQAYRKGWGYSLCYGVYRYKNAVLDKLKGE